MTDQVRSRNARILLFLLALLPLVVYLIAVVRQAQADRYIRRARAQQEALPEAARWLARALDKTPGDADTWIELGNIYQLMATGRAASSPAEKGLALEQAEAAYRNSIEAAPTVAASHINLGWVRYQLDALHERPPAEAVKRSFRLAARLDPFNYYAHFLLGNYLLHEGNTEEAFREYREAIRAYPHDEVIRSIIQTAMGRFTDYETLTQVIPEGVALAHFYLIMALWEQPGRWEECKQEFEKILALEPRNTYYRDIYLQYCIARQDVAAAVREVAARQALLGKEPEVLLRLAEFLKNQGEWDRAMDAVMQVRDVAPRHPRVTTLAAEIQAGQGNIVEAVKAYEAHLKNSPRDPEAAFRLAEIYRTHGNRYKAAELYLQAAFLAPDQVRFQSRLADAYIELGMHDQALEVLERCKRLAPDEFYFYVQSGRIRMQRNDWIQAGRDFGEALKRNPGHEESLRGFLKAEARTP